MSNSLQPHGLQHTRPPCPSPTPRVYPNSCPLSQWCYPTISSSVIAFSSHLQSFPASGSFKMSQLFASGGQSIDLVRNLSFYMFSQIISFRFSWSVSPHSFLLLNSYPSFLFTCLPVPKTSLCSFSNSWGWMLIFCSVFLINKLAIINYDCKSCFIYSEFW